MSNITPYKLADGRVVNLPMGEIRKNMALLNLSRDEAIQMYLEDEGYLINEEQEALNQKAKDNRITAKIHQAKSAQSRTHRERVVKEDLTKEQVITTVATALDDIAEDIQIVNKSKIITFKIGNDTFKIDLIRNRQPKEKGKV